MTLADIGIPTHHTRVERWECDFNDHWNTRFYGRSFQMAAETLAADASGIAPERPITQTRHMRFHREIFVSAPVEVRSAVVKGGRMDGAILHVLLSNGVVSATALDRPLAAADNPPNIPSVAEDEIALALPRGIAPQSDPGPTDGWDQIAPVILGPVRRDETDHRSALTFESIIRHGAVASHDHLNRIGFTTEYSKRSRTNRMSVEYRAELGQAVPVGTVLLGQSRLVRAAGKNFWTGHRIVTTAGSVVAQIEQCLIAVNLDTRRAVEVPDFVLSASLASQAPHDTQIPQERQR